MSDGTGTGSGPRGRPRSWRNLTSPEVTEVAAEDPVLVLPLGSVEQHGPHLPLSTDLDIAAGLVRRALDALADDFPAWVLPPIPLGASAEHGSFAGTLALEPEVLTGIVRAIGAGLARSGARRLVLFSGHGGNRAALESAGLALRREEGMLVVRADPFGLPRPPDAGLPESEWRLGIHGGAVETAMMLHLHPDSVRRSEIGGHPSLDAELEEDLRVVRASGGAPFSWLAEDLHQSGAVGDAGLATPELGAKLVAHYAAVLADVLRDAKAFPLERLR